MSRRRRPSASCPNRSNPHHQCTPFCLGGIPAAPAAPTPTYDPAADLPARHTVLVVGAGLAGLSLCRVLAEDPINYDVTCIEQDGQAGEWQTGDIKLATQRADELFASWGLGAEWDELQEEVQAERRRWAGNGAGGGAGKGSSGRAAGIAAAAAANLNPTLPGPRGATAPGWVNRRALRRLVMGDTVVRTGIRLLALRKSGSSDRLLCDVSLAGEGNGGAGGSGNGSGSDGGDDGDGEGDEDGGSEGSDGNRPRKGSGTSSSSSSSSTASSSRKGATEADTVETLETMGPFDLVVGADGLLSTVRQLTASPTAAEAYALASRVALIGDARRVLGGEWDLGYGRVSGGGMSAMWDGADLGRRVRAIRESIGMNGAVIPPPIEYATIGAAEAWVRVAVARIIVLAVPLCLLWMGITRSAGGAEGGAAVVL